MHRIDGAVLLALVLFFGPVAWAFGWVAMDSLRTRSQARARDRIMRRYGTARSDNDHRGRHSLRSETDDGDGDERPITRGRHALDDQDEVLTWEWPSRDLDELGDDAVDAVTEVLPIKPVRDRAEDDTMPNPELRVRAALDEPRPEPPPGNVPRPRPRHSREPAH